MVLISLLFVIICILAGFLVSYNFLAGKIPQLEAVRGIAEGSKFYMGLASVVIGIWKFISPSYAADATSNLGSSFGRLAFVGDLIPAFLVTASGILLWKGILVYINLSENPELSLQRKSALENFLDNQSDIIGLATITFGIIHIIDIIVGGYPLI